MGTFKRYTALAGVMVAAATAGMSAKAADLLSPPMLPEPAFELGASGGWYLRGDIGFSNQHVEKLQNAAAPVGTPVFQKGFDSAPFGGVGIGYKFNDWLRGDVTAEYRGRANFHGVDRYADFGSASGTGFATNEYYGSKSEAVGLVNLYIDLGTWSGFTPFVGGGVGIAYNTIHDWRDTNVPTGSTAFGRDKSGTKFAWAGTAGVSYAVSPNFAIEFAYRYLNLGDIYAPAVYTYLGQFGAPKTKLKSVDSQDFKIGFRWMLGETAYEQPPLIRRN